MEVPATVAGKLVKISVAIGDKVQEGQVIAVVEVADAAAGAAPKASPVASTPTKEADTPSKSAAAAPTKPAAATPTKRSAAQSKPASVALRKLEVRIPDIGDAKDVVVIEIAVKPGQTVAPDDLLVVVESDKASMEIPAPVAGRIISVDVKEGDSVEQGSLLVVIETSGDVMPSSDGAPKTESVAVNTPPSDEVARPPERSASTPRAETPTDARPQWACLRGTRGAAPCAGTGRRPDEGQRQRRRASGTQNGCRCVRQSSVIGTSRRHD